MTNGGVLFPGVLLTSVTRKDGKQSEGTATMRLQQEKGQFLRVSLNPHQPEIGKILRASSVVPVQAAVVRTFPRRSLGSRFLTLSQI